MYLSIHLSLSLAQVSFCDNDEPLWPNPACNTQLAPFSSFLITFRHEWELQLFNLSLVKREGAFSIIVLIVEKGEAVYFILSFPSKRRIFCWGRFGPVSVTCNHLGSPRLSLHSNGRYFEQYSFLSTIRIDSFVYQFELNTFSCIIRSLVFKARLRRS